jgi:hypothetical protein
LESSPAAEASSRSFSRSADDVSGCNGNVDAAGLTPAEAARRLGVTRSRIYALVRQGELDDIGGDVLRVTLASVERRLSGSPACAEAPQVDRKQRWC